MTLNQQFSTLVLEFKMLNHLRIQPSSVIFVYLHATDFRFPENIYNSNVNLT